jgi:hypothetical protein
MIHLLLGSKTPHLRLGLYEDCCACLRLSCEAKNCRLLSAVKIARSTSRSQLDSTVEYALLSASFRHTLISCLAKYHQSGQRRTRGGPQTSCYARTVFGWCGIKIAEDSHWWSYDLMDLRSVWKAEYMFTANVLHHDCPRSRDLKRGIKRVKRLDGGLGLGAFSMHKTYSRDWPCASGIQFDYKVSFVEPLAPVLNREMKP